MTPAIDDAYRGDRVLIFTAIFIPLQVAFVALRYLSRYLVASSWGLDDVLVAVSLTTQITMGAIVIGAVKHTGLGRHIHYLLAMHPEQADLWSKYVIAISALYWATLNVPKFAILALYHRIFPNKTYRVAIYALSTLLIVHTIVNFTILLSGCTPFAANGNPTIPGAKCSINKEAFSTYGNVPSIVTDILILILPVRVAWKLQLCPRLKVGLMVTFLVGSLGIITAIVRFAFFFHNNAFTDSTWTGVDLTLTTEAEVGTYLISACLMTYRPLIERVGYGKGYLSKIWARDSEKIYKRSSSDSSMENGAAVQLQPRSQLGTQDVHGFQRLDSDNEQDRGFVRTDIYH